jgi:hypothetical protein
MVTTMLRKINGVEATFSPGAKITDIKLHSRLWLAGRMQMASPQSLYPIIVRTTANTVLINSYPDPDGEFLGPGSPQQITFLMEHSSSDEEALRKIMRYKYFKKLQLLFCVMVLAPHSIEGVLEKQVGKYLEKMRKRKELSCKWEWANKAAGQFGHVSGVRIYDTDTNHLTVISEKLEVLYSGHVAF